jgi:hypothetical protein
VLSRRICHTLRGIDYAYTGPRVMTTRNRYGCLRCHFKGTPSPDDNPRKLVLAYLEELEANCAKWLPGHLEKAALSSGNLYHRVFYLVRHSVFNLGILRLELSKRNLRTPDWTPDRNVTKFVKFGN